MSLYLKGTSVSFEASSVVDYSSDAVLATTELHNDCWRIDTRQEDVERVQLCSSLLDEDDEEDVVV